MNHPVVLGIDPGYDRVGWAIGNYNQQRKVTLTDFGCIQTTKKDPIFSRFKAVQDQLTTIINKHNPTSLAIESIFFSNNKTTAIKVAEAKGLIIASCLPYFDDVTEYTPSQIKLAVTGNGAANKKAVIKMVELQTGLDLSKEIDDTVDAIGVVITHLAHYRSTKV